MVEEKCESQFHDFGYFEGYKKLLNFVNNVAKSSCCNVCGCHSCEAFRVLKEMGENVDGEDQWRECKQ